MQLSGLLRFMRTCRTQLRHLPVGSGVPFFLSTLRVFDIRNVAWSAVAFQGPALCKKWMRTDRKAAA